MMTLSFCLQEPETVRVNQNKTEKVSTSADAGEDRAVGGKGGGSVVSAKPRLLDTALRT